MIDFIDRVSSGKKLIKYQNGTTETVTIENVEDATVKGTPINRETLMGVQGFLNNNVTITQDSNGGYIITTIMPESGHKLTTTLVEEPDGSMTVMEVFEGEKIMTKTTTINAEMNSIEEVIR